MRCGSLRRAGFTLIEMLVVTIIIGILVSLVSVAVMAAIRTAVTAGQYSEEQHMTLAFQSMGRSGFPPADMSIANDNDVGAPIAKWFRDNFPRYDLGSGNTTVATLRQDLLTIATAVGGPNNTTTFDPGYALVFWLVGFDDNDARPLDNHDLRMKGMTPDSRKKWAFQFEVSRLKSGRYLMSGASGVALEDTNADGAPQAAEKYNAYVYFDSSCFGDATNNPAYGNPKKFGDFGCYRQTPNNSHLPFNQDTCQIICAGRDKKLGNGGAPPSEARAYEGVDADNVGNFAGGANMKDFIEKTNKL